uniref:Uncharacterized protein n=1 Tax=Arundo donax TaxID=35708 RepID=A0A0A9Q1T1_ARUDO
MLPSQTKNQINIATNLLCKKKYQDMNEQITTNKNLTQRHLSYKRTCSPAFCTSSRTS